MTTNPKFLSYKGNYKNLKAYQKAECVYDVTYYFAHHFFERGDRTIDQMVQAARSGKQNIVEGNAAAIMSIETELKLYNVARASLQELLTDYEDFLRVRGLMQWRIGESQHTNAREVCRAHNDSEFYRAVVETRTSETIANIAIILIHQTDALVRSLFESRKQHFVRNGGVREEMTRTRLATRNKE